MPLHPMVILFLRHGKTAGTPVMPVTENAPRQLVLKSGSTTLTLDKDAGKVILQRKFLMWNLKPAFTPIPPRVRRFRSKGRPAQTEARLEGEYTRRDEIKFSAVDFVL